jgi:hypothetical protein
VAYFRIITNYPLLPSSMFHSGKASAATVYKINALVMKIITSYVTLKNFNGAKVILHLFSPSGSSY